MNYLWRKKMKQVSSKIMNQHNNSGLYTDEDIAEIVDMGYSDGFTKSDTPIHNASNIHRHPVVQFAEYFNEVTTTLQTDEGFYEDEISELINVGSELVKTVNDGQEMSAFNESLKYLQELLNMIQSPPDTYTFEEMYIAYFYAFNHIKRSGDAYDQYFASIEPPDKYFEYDKELLPDPDNIPPKAILAWHNRHSKRLGKSIHTPYSFKSVTATKHNLSLRQMIVALRKVYDLMNKSQGMWVFTNIMISGLSKEELQALAEEGLIKIQGNKFTLTRQGFEKPQWYIY